MLLGPRESCKDTSCYYETVHAITNTPLPPLRAQKATWHLGKESSTQSVTLILLAFLAVDVNFVVFCREKKKNCNLARIYCL